jgi:large subunit ribosomal protein L4
MVRLALLSALSDRAATDRIALIDQWGFEEPKTKDAVTVLRKLRLKGSVLVVLAEDELVADRSFNNLPNVSTTEFNQLSAHAVLKSDWILFSDRTLPGSAEAVPATEEVAPPKKAAAKKKAPAAAVAEDAVTEEVDADA